MYDYVKLKYSKKAKIFYMDTSSFIFCIKANNIFEIITENIEIRSGTSNYELNIPILIRKNSKVIGVITNELG